MLQTETLKWNSYFIIWFKMKVLIIKI